MNTTADRKTNRVMGSGNTSAKSAKMILGWPLRFLTRVKSSAFLIFINTSDACYDLYRYIRYSNSVNQSSDDPQKLESLLFFYYHKIEKALTLPTVKPLFGLGYIQTTLNLAEKWVQRTGDVEAVVFKGAYAALAQYQMHVQQALSQTKPDIALRLDHFLTQYALPDLKPAFGGTKTVSCRKDQGAQAYPDFQRLILQRHSVRNFIDRHILDGNIIDAIKLAQHTPSVCNRQCWRVHVFTTPADKARILRFQNGNEGFGHLADRVLLITADLRSFLLSGERHQGAVDSGMFAMTLILALEAQGIASCCLNLCLSASAEIAFRRESGISEYEVPIMLIVIGYPPESLEVAVSSRKSIDSMLAFH